MTDETDKALALRILRATLRDEDARPADRVAAARLLLETESATRGGDSALHDATDEELLRIARGDTPRVEGPVTGAAVAVPSEAQALNAMGPPLTATDIGAIRSALSAPGGRPDVMLVSATAAKTFAQKAVEGTQKRTRKSKTPGGPKTDPWARKTDPPIASQIKIDNTPAAPPPAVNPYD